MHFQFNKSCLKCVITSIATQCSLYSTLFIGLWCFFEIKRVKVSFVQNAKRLSQERSIWELTVQQRGDSRVKRGHRIHLTIQIQSPKTIQTILMGVEKQRVTTAAILIVIAEDPGATQRISARDSTIVIFPSALLVRASRLSCVIQKGIKSNLFWFFSTNDVFVLSQCSTLVRTLL